MEEGITTLRSINEAVRNIGRTTPHDLLSVTSGGPKRDGPWIFVPRGAQSLQPQQDADVKSTKPGSSIVWPRGLKRVFNFPKKPEEQHSRSVKFKQISNPIPHPSLLEDVDRIGTDFQTALRHQRPFSSYTSDAVASSSGLSPGGTGRTDNPIRLEAKDFDSASDSDHGYSPASSVPPVSTPPDAHAGLPMESGNKDFGLKVLPPLQIQPAVRRPSAPSSPHGSFSRPTPSAYPMLFRMSLESQEMSSPIPRSPMSSSSSSLPSPRIQAHPLSPRPRPPVPSRNPARSKPSSVSENGHAPPISYKAAGVSPGVRRSVSHSVLRI